MIVGLVGALAVFLAVMFVAIWMADAGGTPSDARVRTLALGRGRLSMAEVPFRQRILLPMVDGITRAVTNMLPAAFVARTEQRLTEAGKPLSVQAFFAVSLTSGVLLPLFLLALILSGSKGAPGAILLLVPVAAFFGLGAPFAWLSRRARNRQLAIWKSLPAAFDLITTCVEAGLGLDAAFQRVADKLQGPFTEEIRQMLLEVEMGRPRREALQDLARRTGVPDLLTFVNAVIQTQQMGTNLGKVLRAQAYQMRVKRRQRAEETARKMPIKMVFPLVFCMIPALLIVILGPVALTLMNEFSD